MVKGVYKMTSLPSPRHQWLELLCQRGSSMVTDKNNPKIPPSPAQKKVE